MTSSSAAYLNLRENENGIQSRAGVRFLFLAHSWFSPARSRGVVRRMHWFTAAAFFVFGLEAGFGAGPEPAADRWLTEAGARPERFAEAAVMTNEFATLRAEAVAGVLQVKCDEGESFAELQLIASADAPGHWPARDWRVLAMRRAGPGWLTDIPVDSPDVPQIYFVAARVNGRPVVSPMRLALPRALGLERSSRLFWAFIEGFEQGLDGWRATGGGLRTNAMARSGRAALAVQVPAGRKSVSVESTRLRGWFIQEHGAEGVALWLRTAAGSGRAVFTLAAQAFSTNQVMSRRSESVSVSTNWAKARLTFESFPKMPLADLDLMILEFVAEPGTELLLDDVHWLGRWREDF